MAPSVGDGSTRAPVASPRILKERQCSLHVAERDDGFVESCGQDDEGLGHVVTMFDGEQSDIEDEIDADYAPSRWFPAEV